MSILPKLTCKFNSFQSKSQWIWLGESRGRTPDKHSEIYEEGSRSTTATMVFLKNSKKKEHTISDIQKQHKARLIKTEWYWHRRRETGQWGGRASLGAGFPVQLELCFTKRNLAGMCRLGQSRSNLSLMPSSILADLVNIQCASSEPPVFLM